MALQFADKASCGSDSDCELRTPFSGVFLGLSLSASDAGGRVCRIGLPPRPRFGRSLLRACSEGCNHCRQNLY